jgi:anti-anti-sigma regulatory factor
VDIRDTTSLSSEIVYGDGALRIARAGDRRGLVIVGDIDEFTHADLIAALSRIAEEPSEIHLDLAGVEYCDVAGLRALVALTEAGCPGQGHDGRRVIVHGLPPHLKTVLRILGWDSIPEFVLAEPPRSSRAPHVPKTRSSPREPGFAPPTGTCGARGQLVRPRFSS